jgi:hypothetical protein
MNNKTVNGNLIKIFSDSIQNDIKRSYDDVLYKVLKSFDSLLFTPNLSCKESELFLNENFKSGDRGTLYNDITEISVNYAVINILSTVKAKTSFRFDIVFPYLIGLRKSLKDQIAQIHRSPFSDSIYIDTLAELNTIQSNIKLFLNCFWDNIGKSVLIASEINLKKYVYDYMVEIHNQMNNLYGKYIIASDFDTFYLTADHKIGDTGIVNALFAKQITSLSLNFDTIPTFGVLPNGDYIKIRQKVDSFEHNGFTMRVKQL